MSRMVEVVIDSVRVSLTNQQRIVVLREINAERYLPIWIGPYEAEAITIALQEIEVARPQTHDLIKNIFNALNAQIMRVEIVSLREDVFFGNLVVDANGVTINIDSRPSDALALAVRTHVPILIAQDVMETAGIIPERDLNTQEVPPASKKAEASEGAADKESEERLSVFEDFLSNLDLDNLSGPDKENPNEDLPDDDKTK